MALGVIRPHIPEHIHQTNALWKYTVVKSTASQSYSIEEICNGADVWYCNNRGGQHKNPRALGLR
jgi:hypothetical protein